MKSTSTPCQFLQSSARNRVSFQTKPNNPEPLFDAWSGPCKPPIACLRVSYCAPQALCTNLGEKKANVKRNARTRGPFPVRKPGRHLDRALLHDAHVLF